jgi:hypothetical protein
MSLARYTYTMALIEATSPEQVAITHQSFAAMEHRLAEQWLAAGVVGKGPGPGQGGWAYHKYLSAVFADRARLAMGMEPMYPMEH